MKILAILGSNEGIDTDTDRHYLENLLGKNVATWLARPNRQQLSDRLWQDKWDIFFFAGHSSSDDESGKIYLNATESITVAELKYALRNAVKNGLKLAIFNSCDGLGLAKDLADLQIPHTIVMREPVPDEVAHKFLRYFLEAFARGLPLYQAVKQAREKLQGLEKDIPCASWLPIIYETPGAKPIAWHFNYSDRRPANLILITSVAIALSIFGLFAPSVINFVLSKIDERELDRRISQGEKILFNESDPSKEEGVKQFAAGNCGTAKNYFTESLKSDRNDPETLIYLNNAMTCDRENLKIVASVPIGTNPNIAKEILRGVAQSQDEINRRGGINGKLLKVVIANDDNDSEIADKLAKRFISDRYILAVVGHNASDVSVAICATYGRGKLVAISPTSFSVRLSRCSPYVFRTVPNVRLTADRLSNYAFDRVKKSHILICIDADAEDNRSFADEFRNGLSGQPVKISKIGCDLSNKNLDPERLIEQALKSNVDAIVLAPHVNRIQSSLDIAKANRGKISLLASPTLYTSLTIEEGQENVNGIILSVPWHPSSIPGNSFSKKAVKLWGGQVTWRTAYAYDAVSAIAKALETSNTRQELQQTLSDANFFADGATGKIEFLSSGDRDGKAYLVQIQKQPDGTYRFVPLLDVRQSDRAGILPK